MFSSIATITSEAWTNQSPKNVNTYLHTYLLSSKTMRGSLFPLFSLRVKCQNHERVPISPISPILVVHVLSSCHPGKTLRGSLLSLFWWPMSWQDDKTWTTKIGEIGEIGTLSWFWRFTLRGNRGNRDPVMVSCFILTDYGNCRDLCL